jgi:hypothetical protein
MSPHNVSFYLIVVLIMASIIVGLIPLLSLLTLFIGLSKRALTGGLKAEDLSSTFVRFLVSKHVYDLRLIFFAAIVAFLVSLLVLLFHAETRTHDSTFDQAVTYLGPRMLTYLGPIAAVCVTAAAWAYQTASKRLGVVDIFACEISTLCRVGTLFGSGSSSLSSIRTQTRRLEPKTSIKLALRVLFQKRVIFQYSITMLQN